MSGRVFFQSCIRSGPPFWDGRVGWFLPAIACGVRRFWMNWLQIATDVRVLDAEGNLIRRAPRNEGFKCLGTMLSFEGRNTLEFEHRVKRAWGVFFKYRSLLCNRSSALYHRFRMLSKLVEPSICWCASSWHLTVRRMERLDTALHMMSRRMIGQNSKKDEKVADFLERVNSNRKRLRRKMGLEEWSNCPTLIFEELSSGRATWPVPHSMTNLLSCDALS